MREVCTEDFIAAAREFGTWAGAFDAARETIESVVARLDSIWHPCSDEAVPPLTKRFKPNERWQDVRRRVAAWRVDGYRTPEIPNEDETAETVCSVAYDIADFDEILWNAPDSDDRAKYFEWIRWPYTLLRIRACRDAVVAAGRSGEDAVMDPFKRLPIFGKAVRFVTWRTSSGTHASEDSEDVPGASTVCGGRLAFHKHTQQQWSCQACVDCYAMLRGEPHPHGWPKVPPLHYRDGYSRPSWAGGITLR